MSEKDKVRLEWTTKQLAEAAGVSDNYIRQELKAGRIIGRRIGGRNRGVWVINNSAAQAWLESRKDD